MNLKIRFALIFTIYSAIILSLSLGSIFLLSSNYRKSAFYNQLKNNGLHYYNRVMPFEKYKSDTFDIYQKELLSQLKNQPSILILDANRMILHSYPDTFPFNISAARFKEIIAQQELLWTDNNRYEFAGVFIKKNNHVIIVSGYDNMGYTKKRDLAWILFIIFLAGLFLARLIAYLFIKHALLPLTNLSLQIKETNFSNLTRRIDIGKSSDEIDGIARNFNEMLDRLNGAIDAQKNFVFHASHELRTPLATMQSITESALNKDLSISDYNKTLYSLQEEQLELIELTNSLLLISQYDNLDYIQDFTAIRIDEILYDTISHAKKMFNNLDVQLLFNLIPESDEDFIIFGNATLLKAVFTNLIKNAYMYSIDQKVVIQVETDGKVIFVHFDNFGTQLPADETDKLMTPFFRGGNALKTKGYGLGLSIVHRYITSHKGTINYTPIGENINRFTITLNNAMIHDRAQKNQSM